MRVNEVFDTKIDVSRNKGSMIDYEFQIDGFKFVVVSKLVPSFIFERLDTPLNDVFEKYPSLKVDATNFAYQDDQGNFIDRTVNFTSKIQFKVFSAMKQIFEDVVETKKPDVITFGYRNNEPKGRKRLYERFTREFQKRSQYKYVTEYDDSRVTMFYITNNKDIFEIMENYEPQPDKKSVESLSANGF